MRKFLEFLSEYLIIPAHFFRYRSIFDNAVEGIFQSTPYGAYIKVNPALATMYGYKSPKELMENLTNIDKQLYVDPERRKTFIALMRTKGIVRDFESEVYRKDGSTIWISENARCAIDRVGGLRYYEGMVIDITSQRLLEIQLKEQATLLEQTQDAIIVYDLEGRVLFWNHGAETLYGTAKAFAAGAQVSEASLIPSGILEMITSTVLEKGVWTGEIRHTTKAKKLLYTQSRFSLIQRSTAQPKAILAIITDVTQIKRTEEQLLRTQRLDSLGTLSGAVAHDINNILAPILMTVELLKQQALQPNSPTAHTLANLNTIELSAIRGAEVVRQLLTFAKGTSHDIIEVNLTKLIHDLTSIITETYPKTIELLVDIAQPLKYKIIGDPVQIYQVLLNLCLNARDAMPSGGKLSIRVSEMDCALVNPDTKEGSYVVISVDDTGEGIPSEALDKIFDPFFTTKPQGKGTGLGLTSSRSIIKNHGGFINVYSEVGRGTTFKVYLPAALNSPNSKVTPAPNALKQGKGETILVVEDEPSIRDVTCQLLQQAGYVTLEACNGREGLDIYKLHSQDISLVLTDMGMPVMGGLLMLKELHKLQPTLKIVVTSGFTPDAHELSNENITGSLTKPYSAYTLINTIQQALNL